MRNSRIRFKRPKRLNGRRKYRRIRICYLHLLLLRRARRWVLIAVEERVRGCRVWDLSNYSSSNNSNNNSNSSPLPLSPNHSPTPHPETNNSHHLK